MQHALAIAARATLAASFLLLLSGCGGSDFGPPRVEVTGKVTRAGQPLTKGLISFHPPEGQSTSPATGHIQPDGTYQLGTYEPQDGVVPGSYRVTVLCYETNMETGEDTLLIPARYSSAETSGLTAEVRDEQEPQVIDFELGEQ